MGPVAWLRGVVDDEDHALGVSTTNPAGSLDVLGGCFRLALNDHEPQPADIKSDRNHVRGEAEINGPAVRISYGKACKTIPHLICVFAAGQFATNIDISHVVVATRFCPSAMLQEAFGDVASHPRYSLAELTGGIEITYGRPVAVLPLVRHIFPCGRLPEEVRIKANVGGGLVERWHENADIAPATSIFVLDGEEGVVVIYS